MYWEPTAKIAACAVVEYGGDWGGAQRRAFCGNRFQFSDDLHLHDWTSLAPGIPFAFLRDAGGFALEEMRVSKTTLDWLKTHPPSDTFMLSKPPPTTALAALKEQFDRPYDVAVASWTSVIPTFPLRYDPRHPDQPMPAKYVEDRQGLWSGWQILAVLAVLLAIPGFFVWRIGMRLFFVSEPSPIVMWILTILPLLALPWWGDALPKLLRHVNKDWASIGTDMLDDFTRTSRMLASAPAEATLADDERLIWHLDHGEYADTFGRIRFTAPVPAPTTREAVLDALGAQAATQVLKFTPEDQLALFQRLTADKENRRDRDQMMFTAAAEAIERDPNADPVLHRATRRFLLFGAGYMMWDVEALEKSWAEPSVQPGSNRP